jgi:hypothetical protein
LEKTRGYIEENTEKVVERRRAPKEVVEREHQKR